MGGNGFVFKTIKKGWFTGEKENHNLVIELKGSTLDKSDDTCHFWPDKII